MFRNFYFNLQNFSIDNYGVKSFADDKAVRQKLHDGLKKFSATNFEPKLIESWVELLEQLLPAFSASLASLFHKENSEGTLYLI